MMENLCSDKVSTPIHLSGGFTKWIFVVDLDTEKIYECKFLLFSLRVKKG